MRLRCKCEIFIIPSTLGAEVVFCVVFYGVSSTFVLRTEPGGKRVVFITSLGLGGRGGAQRVFIDNCGVWLALGGLYVLFKEVSTVFGGLWGPVNAF